MFDNKNVRGSGDRQPNDEAGTEHATGAVAAVFGGNLAIERFDDLSADRQPQPGMLAKALAARPLRVEPVENMLEVGIRNARTVVLDAQFRDSAGIAHPHDDSPTRGAEGMGVA